MQADRPPSRHVNETVHLAAQRRKIGFDRGFMRVEFDVMRIDRLLARGMAGLALRRGFRLQTRSLFLMIAV